LTLSCISGIFREMKSGIYKITNKVNGKFYIGSSYDIEERWVVHKQYLHGNYHVNPKLQHAWNKYGEDNFVFEILEEVEAKQDLLFERENYYLSTLKPYERDVGLNICPKAEGGDNITHNPNRDKFIEKMKVVNAGEGNGMFGKKHSENSILEQKEKAKGRYTLAVRLYRIQISDKDFAVEFRTNNLLSVTGHNTTSWREVNWVIDQWGLNEWNVWSIHSTCFEEVISTETQQNDVIRHVRVLVNLEARSEAEPTRDLRPLRTWPGHHQCSQRNLGWIPKLWQRLGRLP
jgi:group I intron endonuclease